MSMDSSLLQNDDETEKKPYPKSVYIGFGAVVTCLIWLVIYYALLNDDCSSSSSSVHWKASDYESVDSYYDDQDVSGFTVYDNMRADRVSDPVLSPDGSAILFTRKQYQMPDSKQSTTTIHLLRLGRKESWLNTTAKPIQLTRPEYGISDFSPAWSPNGKVITFLSNRASDGSTQLFQIKYVVSDLPEPGSTDFISPIQFSFFPISIDNYLWAPSGDKIAFSMQLYPNTTIEQTVSQQQAIASDGGNSLTFDKLFIRHWDTFRDGTRNTPLITEVSFSKSKYSLVGQPYWVLWGVDTDIPTKPYGGAEEWSFSPDGSRFAFTRRHDETSAVAWTTNLDVYWVSVSSTAAGGANCLTCDNLASDSLPRFSPDGNRVAWLAMNTPVYESDRQRIKYMDLTTGDVVNVTADWTLSVDSADWSNDGNYFWTTVLDNGDHTIKKVDLSGVPTVVIPTGSADAPVQVDENQIVFGWNSWTQPPTIAASDLSGANLRFLVTYNNELIEKRSMTSGSKFSFIGSYGDTVSGWLFEPVNRVEGQRYPVAFLIHGGPQGAWESSWSWRWNPQVYTGAGWAVVAINPHGSTGYGQAFCDKIQGDYGGGPFNDLMVGLDYILNQTSWLDSGRVAALGASYGGFMINWIAGQTGENDRFRVLVCHDGMFDIPQFYFSTEELWFPEHDMPGVPWNQTNNFNQWNPSLLVDQWHLPMLIIHGGLDYRITEAQGFGAFTALQRRGIESKLLYFPKENHWVLNARNQIKWHETVLDWITTHTQ